MATYDIATERWLPVVGYEGSYEVSDLGRVRSLDRTTRHSNGRFFKRRGKVLRPGGSAYLTVALYSPGRRPSLAVHSLVLTAFVGPRPEGMEACHGLGGPLDNRLSNLRWDTPSENRFDQVRHGTHHQAGQKRCKRKHLLHGSNLLPGHVARGWRGCRACRYATGQVYRTGRGDVATLADEYYARLKLEPLSKVGK